MTADGGSPDGGAGALGRRVGRTLDLRVSDQPVDSAGGVELVDDGSSRSQVGPLDVESGQAGIVPAGSRPAAQSLTELVLGDPFHHLGGRPGSVVAPLLEGVEDLPPQGQGTMGLNVLDTGDGRADGVEDGALNLQGGHGPDLGSQLV